LGRKLAIGDPRLRYGALLEQARIRRIDGQH
jgi:hypothetical protein